MTPEELTAALRPGDRERLRRRGEHLRTVREVATRYGVDFEALPRRRRGDPPPPYRLSAGTTTVQFSDLREAEIWLHGYGTAMQRHGVLRPG